MTTNRVLGGTLLLAILFALWWSRRETLAPDGTPATSKNLVLTAGNYVSGQDTLPNDPETGGENLPIGKLVTQTPPITYTLSEAEAGSPPPLSEILADTDYQCVSQEDGSTLCYQEQA